MFHLTVMLLQLIRVTEEKLVSLLPPKEKKRYLSLSHKATPSEIAEAEGDLLNWNKMVATKEVTLLGELRKSGNSGRSSSLPPVRGSGAHHETGKVARSECNKLSEGDQLRSPYSDIFELLNPSQRKKFEKLSTELDVQALSEIKRQYKAGEFY